MQTGSRTRLVDRASPALVGFALAGACPSLPPLAPCGCLGPVARLDERAPVEQRPRAVPGLGLQPPFPFSPDEPPLDPCDDDDLDEDRDCDPDPPPVEPRESPADPVDVALDDPSVVS